jgi:hypothetical protein
MDSDDRKKTEAAGAGPKLVDELAKMEYEPLLPIEKKLIAYSLILGVGLLAALALISNFAFAP